MPLQVVVAVEALGALLALVGALGLGNGMAVHALRHVVAVRDGHARHDGHGASRVAEVGHDGVRGEGQSKTAIWRRPETLRGRHAGAWVKAARGAKAEARGGGVAVGEGWEARLMRPSRSREAGLMGRGRGREAGLMGSGRGREARLMRSGRRREARLVRRTRSREVGRGATIWIVRARAGGRRGLGGRRVRVTHDAAGRGRRDRAMRRMAGRGTGGGVAVAVDAGIAGCGLMML
jgi:hypothetical protein